MTTKMDRNSNLEAVRNGLLTNSPLITIAAAAVVSVSVNRQFPPSVRSHRRRRNFRETVPAVPVVPAVKAAVKAARVKVTPRARARAITLRVSLEMSHSCSMSQKRAVPMSPRLAPRSQEALPHNPWHPYHPKVLAKKTSKLQRAKMSHEESTFTKKVCPLLSKSKSHKLAKTKHQSFVRLLWKKIFSKGRRPKPITKVKTRLR